MTRCYKCGKHIFYSKGRWHHYHRQHHWAAPRYTGKVVIYEESNKTYSYILFMTLIISIIIFLYTEIILSR